MKNPIHIVFILFSLYVAQALAEQYICVVGYEVRPEMTVAWDTDTRRATMEAFGGRKISGNLVLQRDHDGGFKVNLRFPHWLDGIDESEYVIFTIPGGGFRVLGVTYVIRDGERYVHTSDGSNSARCSSL